MTSRSRWARHGYLLVFWVSAGGADVVTVGADVLTVGSGVVVLGVGVVVDGEGAAVAVVAGDVLVGGVVVAGVGAAMTGARAVVAGTGALGCAVEKAVEVLGAAAGACAAAPAVNVSGAGVAACAGVDAVGDVSSCAGVLVALGVLGAAATTVAVAVAVAAGGAVMRGEAGAGGAEVVRFDPATISPAIPTAVAAGISTQRRRGRRRAVVIGAPASSRTDPNPVSGSVSSMAAGPWVSSPTVTATSVAVGRAVGSVSVIARSSGAQPGSRLVGITGGWCNLATAAATPWPG